MADLLKHLSKMQSSMKDLIREVDVSLAEMDKEPQRKSNNTVEEGAPLIKSSNSKIYSSKADAEASVSMSTLEKKFDQIFDF
jgi:hypothetical protein